MADMNLVWCHGSLSQPWGAKSLALAATAKGLALDMTAPDFQDLENPDQRVERLTALLEKDGRPTILAGSSMGGYVAAAAARTTNVAGLFLLAPAFYLPGYAIHVFTNLPRHVTLVHGWSDDVVPVDNSIRFARSHSADLHIFDDGHRLEGSGHKLCILFGQLLTIITKMETA
ncbi:MULTISPECIES: alpha/beta fold hydrolase [unclassified Pseudodesulfovibrio]|uniref:alpha/beta hydrolase n=1 Tax=unclassified Pseudodesulfovibrio TaxID=2661612 RepID=UPI000FEBDEA3|nr:MULTISPECIES: alpha/beta fold hydrolase [unclassified Pseudodesulfovibrio]MCJ2164829.1 alpha/beta fold hydrolase [Pseudodesulfovibrio sp. S3-i]RWU03802.1 alpha/beta fold hydrolase [Pseudodesulfovibrio sp. S3]